MYAASNIAQAVRGFKNRGYARFGGLILNRRNVEDEKVLVERLAAELDTDIVADLPRSVEVQEAERAGKTVLEALPDSPMADCYRTLAGRVLEVCANG